MIPPYVCFTQCVCAWDYNLSFFCKLCVWSSSTSLRQFKRLENMIPPPCMTLYNTKRIGGHILLPLSLGYCYVMVERPLRWTIYIRSDSLVNIYLYCFTLFSVWTILGPHIFTNIGQQFPLILNCFPGIYSTLEIPKIYKNCKISLRYSDTNKIRRKIFLWGFSKQK